METQVRSLPLCPFSQLRTLVFPLVFVSVNTVAGAVIVFVVPGIVAFVAIIVVAIIFVKYDVRIPGIFRRKVRVVESVDNPLSILCPSELRSSRRTKVNTSALLSFFGFIYLWQGPEANSVSQRLYDDISTGWTRVENEL